MVSTVDKNQAYWLKIATSASVLTAVILMSAKLVAWGLSGSVSVLASLIDSLMDGVASLINLVAVRYALQPADDEHRFGHGKAESLAGLGQATFIAGSAAFLLLHSIDRMMHPREIQHVGTAVTIMGLSVILTTGLLMLQRIAIRKTQSVAIRADSLHYMTDLLTNVGIIIAIVLSLYGWQGFDALFAMMISIYIFYSAWQIGFEAIHLLLDRELPEEITQQIEQILKNDDEVLGVHELRTRQSGHNKIIQMHIDLDGNKSLYEAHQVAERVEQSIREAIPGADVIIHQDPVDPARTNSRSFSR